MNKLLIIFFFTVKKVILSQHIFLVCDRLFSYLPQFMQLLLDPVRFDMKKSTGSVSRFVLS